MRHARPAFQATLAQVQRASAYAGLFTLGAGAFALALPVLVMHAIEVAERRASFDGLMLVTLVAVMAAILRSLLLVARDRILLQAALWFDHTAGAGVLADRLDRGVMPDVLEADRIALDRATQAIAGPALAALLDAIAALLPLTLLFLIHPALGAISLLLVATVIGSALVRARASATAHHKVAATHGAADKAWRIAAANGPMIAIRQMSSGIVADWEAHNRAAIVARYGLMRSVRDTAATLRAADVASCVLIALTGVALVQSESLTLAGLAGAVVLHVMLARSVLAAHDRVADLAALDAGLAHLSSAAPHTITDIADRLSAAAPAEIHASPAQPVAIITSPTHALRPTFSAPTFSAQSPPPPLPQARPPAGYTGGRHRRIS